MYNPQGSPDCTVEFEERNVEADRLQGMYKDPVSCLRL
jgi:hypothetical protein